MEGQQLVQGTCAALGIADDVHCGEAEGERIRRRRRSRRGRGIAEALHRPAVVFRMLVHDEALDDRLDATGDVLIVPVDPGCSRCAARAAGRR
eukprot:scaffold2842_cov277-Pinguiococcus_pyrenoidosus.AAC.1